MAILLGSLSGGMQPSAPTIGTATAGDTTASVAFTPSTYIGKGTITYTATSSPGGFTATGSSSPLTVTGLTNGTAYTFTVVGTTNYGVSSAASAASNSVTPAVAGVWNSIASATGSGTNTITFSAISGSYKHLQIRGTFVPSQTSDLGVSINSGVSAPNNHTYWTQGASVFGGAANVTGNYIYPIQGNFGGDAPTPLILDFMDYANTSKLKTMRTFGGVQYQSNTTNSRMWFLDGYWNTTTAITSISIVQFNGTFTTGNQFALYGIGG